MSKVGILLIATNKYKQFVQPLLNDLKKNFLPGHDLTVFLFTDGIQEYTGLKVEQILIPPYKFPFATLYRYKIFDTNKEHLKDQDYLFYMDVDMSVVDAVGDEFLVDELLCVRHPGFYKSDGWGSSGCDKKSLAFLPEEKRKHYYAGGVQGGESKAYLTACNILHSRILHDETNQVMAEWHDETHWNWLLNSGQTGLKYHEFTPTYCMVEQKNLRELWGISNLPVKIVALNKNHKELRE